MKMFRYVVNVAFPGKLRSELDDYVVYHKQIHGESIGVRTLIVEIVRNFIESDRGFQSWLKREQPI